jgi:hypothetical protein
MKCTNCGLPLSPSRTPTNCPRCGTPLGSDQKATPAPVQHSSYNPEVAQMPGYWQGEPPTFPSQAPQQPVPPGQMWSQGPLSQPGLFQQTSLPRPPLARPPFYTRNAKLGYIVAGLCIFTCALILVFIYFMASGSTGGNSNNTTASIPSPMPSPTTAATPTATAAPSPTASVYPGQQYVDNAQMASAIDTSSSQPTQLTTTFKTNQKIYVAFQVHPAGQNGAVCLLWYLNGKQSTQYSFAVSANSKLSFAYAIYGEPGSAYVEIYWASTSQCTDQVLAQHVDFTVMA